MIATTSEAAIVAAVRTVVGSAGKVALHEPEIGGNEWKYVKECLDSGWVSSVGAFVDRFERGLAELTGARHAIAVVNGTAALHLCLKLAGVRSGDEVLVPTLTFIATANAVSYCGATPHFCDVEHRTLGIDVEKLDAYLREVTFLRNAECFNQSTGARIAAIVPMHTFGHPVDMDALVELGERYGILVIEDAAESLGSTYKGRHTGTIGKLGALSFNGNKIITTGGGGAILTSDEQLAKTAKHLSTTARVPHQWSFQHDEIGYNYRMPNINAAMGVAQLEELQNFIDRKRSLANSYRNAFKTMAGVRFVDEPLHARSNYWLNAICLETGTGTTRDGLLKALSDSNVMARPAWTLMHSLPMYKNCPKMDTSSAEYLEEHLVNLPSSARLGHR